MRRITAPSRKAVKKTKPTILPQQPVPPIGGFPKINRTAFLRGMARSAGLLKGDPAPNVRLKAPKKQKFRTGGPQIAQLTNTAGAGVAKGAALTGRGRRLSS